MFSIARVNENGSRSILTVTTLSEYEVKVKRLFNATEVIYFNPRQQPTERFILHMACLTDAAHRNLTRAFIYV